MLKIETVLSGIISGIVAFWAAYHVVRLVFNPILSWLVYSISDIPAPPGVFTMGEILRIGVRLPSPDSWLALILLGSLAGTSAIPTTSEMEKWQLIRKRLRKALWLCICILLSLLIGLEVVGWFVTERFDPLFDLTGMLGVILWIGLGMWFVNRLEKVRDFIMERWLV